jgi:hypothetical protein
MRLPDGAAFRLWFWHQPSSFCAVPGNRVGVCSEREKYSKNHVMLDTIRSAQCAMKWRLAILAVGSTGISPLFEKELA